MGIAKMISDEIKIELRGNNIVLTPNARFKRSDSITMRSIFNQFKLLTLIHMTV